MKYQKKSTFTSISKIITEKWISTSWKHLYVEFPPTIAGKSWPVHIFTDKKFISTFKTILYDCYQARFDRVGTIPHTVNNTTCKMHLKVLISANLSQNNLKGSVSCLKWGRKRSTLFQNFENWVNSNEKAKIDVKHSIQANSRVWTVSKERSSSQTT